MAINKNISVKVCGNPDSNSGFVPIIFFNNPSFAVEDQFYVGFDNCSYFYTIKTTKTQIIYKLVKNNVRSYGATRTGSLVIAFSVPKNYTIDGGETPYDVLEKLKNEFMKKCMTCKDPVRETYEFNPGRIDQHVLDEVAGEFTISPQPSPDRVMNPSAPKGYIVKGDVEIEKLFHDINYPEFDNYSEVIVAETVNQTGYIQIKNIKIPRLKKYEIYVDKLFLRSCENLNEKITVSSTKSSDYYKNTSVEFTIQKLKDGDIYPGIELQEDKEKIIVSTQGWATPKSETIKLHIVPKEFQNDILEQNLISITIGSYEKKELDNNFSFTLIGEQIAAKKKNLIQLKLKPNNEYGLVGYDISKDEIVATVSKKNSVIAQTTNKVKQDRYQQQEQVTGFQSVTPSPVSYVSITLTGKDNLKSNNDIYVKFKKSDTTVASYSINFAKTADDVYEGHCYVDKKILYGTDLSFRINDKDYITKQHLFFDKGKEVLKEDDFNFSEVSKVELFYKKRSFLIKMLILFMAILLGLIIGYASHDYIKSFSDDTISKDDSVVTDNDNSVVTDNDLPSMTEYEAFVFLHNADSILKIKDLTFTTIDTLYNKYLTYQDTIDIVDKKKFSKKVCGQITDYHTVASFITNGEFENLKETLQVTDLHIGSQHKKLVEKIVKDNKSKNQFKNNYSKINGFADIEKFINVESGTDGDTSAGPATGSGTPSNFKCDRCDTSFPSLRKLNTHKKNEHAPQNKYECPTCGKNIYFNTQKELNNHINKYHSESR